VLYTIVRTLQNLLILNLCSFRRAKDQVTHPYKTAGTFIFIFELYIRYVTEDLDCMVASILLSLSVNVVPNFATYSNCYPNTQPLIISRLISKPHTF
jgi:hypothetical protein